MFLFKHKVYDDYYDKESIYPYPPKDIQLIILRYASMIDIDTCKNIRLVRKCFSKDHIISKIMTRWLTNFERPLKYFQKIKAIFEQYISIKDSYVEKVRSLWERFRGNYRYFYNRNISFLFNYVGKTYINNSIEIHMDDVKLIEVNKKYGEVALLIKSRSIQYPDILFFLYFDPTKNINYAYNDIFSGWLFTDSETQETLDRIKLDETNKNVVDLRFFLNDFEINLLNKHCAEEQEKIDGENGYKGVTVYFGNIDLKQNYNYPVFHMSYIKLDNDYPLPKRANTDVFNSYIRDN